MKKDLLRWLLILMVLSTAIVPAIAAVPVYAATADLAVAGEGGQTGGTYIGGATDYTNINSDDDDTSYLKVGASTPPWYSEHSYRFAAFAIANGGINSVTLTYKVKADGTPNYVIVTPYCRIGGTNYYGTSRNIYGNSYVTKTQVWSTNPATGVAWTDSDLDGSYAEFGIKALAAAQYYVRLTYTYITVDYDTITIPTMSANAASGIGYNGTHYATLNGAITNTGGENADYRGFCYGTTSNATMPSAGEVPPASYTSNVTQTGDFGVDTFDQLITGMVQGTTYYYRAYAHNSEGWAYSAEASFTTLDDPAITTVAASNIANTTARVNGTVTDDGGEASTVQFAYATTAGGPYANYDAIAAAGSTVTAAGTWTTGQNPFYDLTGLLTGTDYTFSSNITNSVSSQYGAQLTFNTTAVIGEPTDFKGIPTSTTISLQWVKGVGATNTMVRGKRGSYPTGVADGTEVYFDDKSSVIWTGLLPGVTYYFKAWGESGGTYSTSNVTLMITTLAASAAADDLPTPATPSQWYQTPDYTKLSNLPFYGMVNWWAEVFEIPYNTMWSMSGLLFAMMVGILAFAFSRKILIGTLVVFVMLIFTMKMYITPGWFLLPSGLITFVSIALGERI